MKTRRPTSGGHTRSASFRASCLTVFYAVILTASVSGCAIAKFELRPEDQPLVGHYVLAHEDGWPATTDRRPLTREEFATQIDRILHGLDAQALRAWAEGQPLRILIFVHGGLNGYEAAFDRMRRLVLDGYDPQGAVFPQTRYYPVFVNWNSALGDSIIDDLVFIRFGKRRAWWAGVPLTPFVTAARLTESVFSAPSGWWANTRNFDDMEPRPLDWIESIVMFPVRGLLSTPLVRAFGTAAWQIMNRRADLLVANRLDRNRADAETGAARTLLDSLCVRLECARHGEPTWGTASGKTGPVEITLVGHSMGALVLNRLVATRHELPVRRIVYLAPASTIDEAEGFVVPYLKEHEPTEKVPGTEFWLFMLAERDEARERDPSGLLPRGTLLVWIDSFFEPATSSSRMRVGRYEGFRGYYGRDRRPHKAVMVCRMTGERNNEPKSHGEFDEPQFLAQILCTVEPGAFVDPAFCTDRRYVIRPVAALDAAGNDGLCH